MSRRRRWQRLALSGPALRLGRGAIRLLGASLRVEEDIPPGLQALWAAEKPVIYVVWHGRLLMLPYLYGRRRRLAALTSRSRDGEVLARFVQSFGIAAVRGSSSRGGGPALLALSRLLRQGTEVVIVPDGPRGPRGVAQAGAALLARLTGARVVPVGVGAAPRTVLRTWDAFVIPRPFARLAVVAGEPMAVAADADEEAIERARRAIQDALRQVTLAADRRVGAGDALDL